ncbi:MAG: hypothetical protein LBP21_06735 [Synergistaceae bacterium]|jgi:hypothetical protein|nr:hypothetical protein [Synergistaceae bacterium]
MNCRVEHFEEAEFLCPCCGEGKVAQVLVLWLDLLRRAWGAPVFVNSGWRCPPHNGQVGGSKSSRHMIGCAADIRVAPATNTSRDMPQWPEFAALAARLCRLPGWEFRLYGSFIHVAVPREEAQRLWHGQEIVL